MNYFSVYIVIARSWFDKGLNEVNKKWISYVYVAVQICLIITGGKVWQAVNLLISLCSWLLHNVTAPLYRLLLFFINTHCVVTVKEMNDA